MRLSPSPLRTAVTSAVAVALATATACSSSAGETGPAAGGTLVFATTQEPDCLDPAVSARGITSLVNRNVFDSLVHQGEDGAFQPWLAEKWVAAPDGLSYTFTLRAGVTFHDGAPLDAAAVKATLDHVVDPATESLYAAGLIGAYDKSEVVDARTVVVRLTKPSAPFLQALSTPALGIQSPKSLADNASGLCEKPVGSGPFTFGSWEKKVGITLAKNPAYAWGPERPGPALLDGLSIRFIPEDAVRVGALTSGQAHVVSTVPPGKAKTLAPATVVSAQLPGAPYTVFLNSAKGQLLHDERLRKALRHAVDLDQLVQTVYFGQYERATGPLSPSTPFYAKQDVPGYDQAAANRLLDEAGWTARDAEGYRVKEGKRLTLRWPHTADMERDQRDQLAQGIQAQAKQVGIEIQYASVDQGAIGEIITTHAHDLFDVSFTSADPDILRYFHGTESTLETGGGNIFGIDHPELDALLVDGVAELDAAARGELYAKAQTYIVEHAVSLPVYVPTELLGVAEGVEGVEFSPQGYPLFFDARVAG